MSSALPWHTFHRPTLRRWAPVRAAVCAVNAKCGKNTVPWQHEMLGMKECGKNMNDTITELREPRGQAAKRGASGEGRMGRNSSRRQQQF